MSSTSGSTSFTYNTQQIITKAFRLLGIYGTNEIIPGEDYSTALDTLNLMIKDWEGEGIYVFTQTNGTLFLNNGQTAYQLGGTNPDKCAQDPVVETQLSASATASAQTLTVNSTTGMNVNDNIGIVLDTQTIYWDTISSIPTSTTVTITGTLPSSASSSNYVYTFTTQIGRPLKIETVRTRKSGGTDTILTPQTTEYKLFMFSRDTYYSLPNRYMQGVPLRFYPDYQETYTILNIWPASSTPVYRIKFSYRRILQDVINTTDSVDFRQEDLMTVVWNLADWLSPEYGKELKAGSMQTQLTNIAAKANKLYLKMLANAQEHAVLKISPSIDYNIKH